MLVSAEDLARIMPLAGMRVRTYLDPLNDAMAKFGIDNAHETASFLAQIAHESGQLSRVVENLNYSAEGLLKTWPKRFTPELAQRVARQPERIANIVYANRCGNGGPETGDGYRYRGHGLIQVTFKDNHRACGEALGLNLLIEPERLREPEYAAASAGWYWQAHKLNQYAEDDDVRDETHIINGGEAGLAQRQAFFNQAIKVLA